MYGCSSRGMGLATSKVLESLEARRLLSAGPLDPSFGSAGWVVAAGVSTSGTSNDALVQSDGKVIQAITNGDGSLVVERLTTAGKLDTSYGTNGQVKLNLGSGAKLGSLLLLSDGSLIVGGELSKSFELVHLKTNGMEDTSFGTKGIASAAFSSGAVLNAAGRAEGWEDCRCGVGGDRSGVCLLQQQRQRGYFV